MWRRIRHAVMICYQCGSTRFRYEHCKVICENCHCIIENCSGD